MKPVVPAATAGNGSSAKKAAAPVKISAAGINTAESVGSSCGRKEALIRQAADSPTSRPDSGTSSRFDSSDTRGWL